MARSEAEVEATGQELRKFAAYCKSVADEAGGLLRSSWLERAEWAEGLADRLDACRAEAASQRDEITPEEAYWLRSYARRVKRAPDGLVAKLDRLSGASDGRNEDA